MYLLILFLLLSTPAAAQEQIGAARIVRGGVRGTVAGPLSPGTGVHANERVQTDKEGVGGLRFKDQTDLHVGPQSDVKLDKFVYDPNKGTKHIILNATKGSFRFSTGAQGKPNDEYKIRTPYGTLGLRGSLTIGLKYPHVG